MLPDIGATELMVIAIVALIVVGPKDLPVLLRRLGQFMAKLRGMAAEFRASFDEMARQSELDELRREVAAMRRGELPELTGAMSGVNTTFDDITKGLNETGGYQPGPYDPPIDPVPAEPPPPLTIAEAPTAPKTPRPRKAPAAKAKVAKAAVAKDPAAKTPRKPRAKKIVEGGAA
jgi:sec-independent protein translocase protein TatB